MNSYLIRNKVLSKLQTTALVIRNLTAVFLFTTSSSFSQNVITNYTVEDGLPSNEVYFTYTDLNNYTWFCTDRGLSRFNGTTFKNFNTEDGLSHNVNFKIFEDNDGNLWFTGYDGSITIYETKTQAFREFQFNDLLRKYFGDYNDWIHYIGFKKNQVYLFPLKRLSDKKSILVFNKLDSTITEKSDSQFFKTGFIEFDNLWTFQNSENEKSKSSYQVIFSRHDLGDSSIWINALSNITMAQGVWDKPSYFFMDGKHFQTNLQGAGRYTKNRDFTWLLDNQVATGLSIDYEGQLWLSTLNRGVFVITTSPFKRVDITPQLKSNEKLTAFSPSINRLVLGTNTSRFILMNDNMEILDKKSMKQGMVRDLFPDSEGSLHSKRYQIELKNSRLEINSIVPYQNRQTLTSALQNCSEVIQKKLQLKPNLTKALFDTLHGDEAKNWVLTTTGSILFNTTTNLYKIEENHIKSLGNVNGRCNTITDIQPIGSLFILSTMGHGLLVQKDSSLIAQLKL